MTPACFPLPPLPVTWVEEETTAPECLFIYISYIAILDIYNIYNIYIILRCLYILALYIYRIEIFAFCLRFASQSQG